MSSIEMKARNAVDVILENLAKSDLCHHPEAMQILREFRLDMAGDIATAFGSDYNERKEKLGLALRAASNEVNYLIMATPTGEKRDYFTDINLHLIGALESFKRTL